MLTHRLQKTGFAPVFFQTPMNKEEIKTAYKNLASGEAAFFMFLRSLRPENEDLSNAANDYQDFLSYIKGGYMPYETYRIPKKSGGYRDILSPRIPLKCMLWDVLVLLDAFFEPSACAMGFVKGKSIADNARTHVGKNYVFNIDLQNFFPSITRDRVFKTLLAEPFNFTQQHAGWLADLSTTKMYGIEPDPGLSKRRVPQGAPTSPIISNAVCVRLDRRLDGLARELGLVYSRYADDITFSSDHNVFQDGSKFRKNLEAIIIEEGFTLNPKKTRLQHRSQHQDVTGLVVNQKVNITRNWIKDVRAVLHIWQKYGVNAAMGALYPRYHADKGALHKCDPNPIAVIGGKLEYLRMIKGADNPLYIKLKAQYDKVVSIYNKNYKSHVFMGWTFLETLPLNAFEKRLGVKVRFRRKQSMKNDNDNSQSNPYYGYFDYRGTFMVVAVSSRLSVTDLPSDVQISLCANGNKYYPLSKPYVFFLHRKKISDARRKELALKKIPETIKETILNLARRFPALDLQDEYGIIEAAKKSGKLYLPFDESRYDES